MTLSYPQTVRIVPRERVAHGDFTEGAPYDYAGVLIQPLGSNEQTRDERALQARWRIFAPVGFPARPQDVLEHQGVRLHVDGELQTWPDLSGRPHHVEGLLKRWEG